MKRWVFLAGRTMTLMALLAVVGATSASAHESPTGCTSSGASVNFDPSSELAIVHRNGDRLTLKARVRNDAADACDVTNATITIQTPNPDGTPGPVTPIATGVTLLAGTPQVTIPTTVPYDVDFNAATFSAFVTVALSGTSHYPGGDITGSIVGSGTPLGTSKPHATLQVSPVLPSGAVPFTATYTYQITNDSLENTAPGEPEPELGNGAQPESLIADDTCPNPTFTGGNTDGEFPPHIDRGETFSFTCSRTFGAPGTFTNTARVVGNSNRDGRPWPQTTGQSVVTAQGRDVRVAKTHDGDFTAGGTGTYTLTASNAGNVATSGAVNVADSLPAGLTASSITGDGWALRPGLAHLHALRCAGGRRLLSPDHGERRRRRRRARRGPERRDDHRRWRRGHGQQLRERRNHGHPAKRRWRRWR